MANWLRPLAPVTNNIKDVYSVLPRKEPEDFSGRVADNVFAQEELERQKKEEKQSLWSRALKSALTGGAFGAGVAATKVIPITHRLWNPEAAIVGGTLAGGASLAFTLARHYLKERIANEAQKTIEQSDPAVKYVADSPRTREEAHNWQEAQWAPGSGAETGALVGGLGTLGALWAAGKNPTGVGSTVAGLAGAGGGALLGLALGKMYKARKQKDFLAHTEQALQHMRSPHAQEAVTEAEVEQAPLLKAALSKIGQDFDPREYAIKNFLYKDLMDKQQTAGNMAADVQRINERHNDSYQGPITAEERVNLTHNHNMLVNAQGQANTLRQAYADLDKPKPGATGPQQAAQPPMSPVAVPETRIAATPPPAAPMTPPVAPSPAPPPIAGPASKPIVVPHPASTSPVTTPPEKMPWAGESLSTPSPDGSKLAVDCDHRYPYVSTNAPLLKGMGGPPERYAATSRGAVQVKALPYVNSIFKQSSDALHSMLEDNELRSLCDAIEKLALGSEEEDVAQGADDPAPPGEKMNGKVVTPSPFPDTYRNPPKASLDPKVESAKGDIGNNLNQDVQSLSGPPSQAAGVQVNPTEKVAAKKKKEETKDGKRLRARAEVICHDGQGVLAIKKDGYLLMPGGGIDEGEDDRAAVVREAIEEADQKLMDVTTDGVIDALYDPKHPIVPGFDGERTTFYSAVDGGKIGAKHKDNEPFKFIPFKEAIAFLADCIADPKNQWAIQANVKRMELIARASGVDSFVSGAEIIKEADVASLLPKNEVLMFSPEGKLAVKRTAHRRFELPSGIEGARAVPYENPVSIIPETGVPDPGVHGYRIGLQHAEGAAPEGFEEVDPQHALNELYAAMGKPENKLYQNLDRARARAILRLVKKRQNVQAPQVV